MRRSATTAPPPSAPAHAHLHVGEVALGAADELLGLGLDGHRRQAAAHLDAGAALPSRELTLLWFILEIRRVRMTYERQRVAAQNGPRRRPCGLHLRTPGSGVRLRP